MTRRNLIKILSTIPFFGFLGKYVKGADPTEEIYTQIAKVTPKQFRDWQDEKYRRLSAEAEFIVARAQKIFDEYTGSFHSPIPKEKAFKFIITRIEKTPITKPWYLTVEINQTSEDNSFYLVFAEVAEHVEFNLKLSGHFVDCIPGPSLDPYIDDWSHKKRWKTELSITSVPVFQLSTR